jgi:hypothetical protein
MKVYAQNDNAGVNLGQDCLIRGNCSFEPYKALKIREEVASPEGNTAKNIVQDIFLWATFFIGTVCTIALVRSWFLMMTAGVDEGKFDQGKKGITASIIGLWLVALSYLIIRAIQFIAQGNQ